MSRIILVLAVGFLISNSHLPNARAQDDWCGSLRFVFVQPATNWPARITYKNSRVNCQAGQGDRWECRIFSERKCQRTASAGTSRPSTQRPDISQIYEALKLDVASCLTEYSTELLDFRDWRSDEEISVTRGVRYFVAASDISTYVLGRARLSVEGEARCEAVSLGLEVGPPNTFNPFP